MISWPSEQKSGRVDLGGEEKNSGVGGGDVRV